MPDTATSTLPDYYEVLQVSPNADSEVIQAAYRRLIAKWHPDRRPGDGDASERTKLLNEAYEVLSDPFKRQEYDLHRKQFVSNAVVQEVSKHPLVDSTLNPSSATSRQYWPAVIIALSVLILVIFLANRREVQTAPTSKPVPVDDFQATMKSWENTMLAIEKQKQKEESDARWRQYFERQTRNENRVKEIAKAIETLDDVIRSGFSEEWQSLTNSYRLGKIPDEYSRDRFFQFLVKMEAHEKSTKHLKINGASRSGSQEIKTGDWKGLRNILSEIEYR